MKLPTTGSDWQLYTSSMKCERAARGLTAALKKVIKSMDTMKPLNASNVQKAMDKYLSPVMNKYGDYGASDSEPRYVARSAVLRAVCEKMEWDYKSFAAREFADALW